MQFRTQIPISISNFSIDYTSRILSLGSCFAENIGEKFSYFKFQNTVNPFGIIFNPISIENLVTRIINKQKFVEDDIFFHNDLWHCFELHSELSNKHKESFLETLNQIIHSTHRQILESTHIIITYGTAWVYRNIESKNIVANCHKVPQKQFKKEILSVENCVASIQNTLDLIQKINPNCKFIFTISPVRHIKDGFVENQQSKSHLITALHNVLQVPTLGAEGAYFPSYEIMMDELRDYRFYGQDMLHPTQVAIDYIWQRFRETYIAETAYIIMDEVDVIQKGASHLPFNANSESHFKFQTALMEKKTKLVTQYPFIKF